MGVAERIRERGTELLTEWTGLSIAPAEEIADLRSVREELGPFLDGVEDLGLTVMDYIGGRPQEVNAFHRRRLAQQSRLALMHDPLAGAEAQLRANFALGKGVGKPQAADDDVQDVIDAAWKDPVNQRKLCSFEAQRHRSNELITTANLYPTVFEKNGKVKIAFVDPDLVTDVVTDPEDDEMPLWYVIRKRKFEWDFKMGRVKPVVGFEMENGHEKVFYLEHWSNVEDTDAWAEELGEAKPPRPGAGQITPGRCEHIRINRVGRTQFGIPPWARTLRFYTAMNQLTESQVQMRQGAASIVAQRLRRTTRGDLMKTASQVVSQTGELAAGAFNRRRTGGPPQAEGFGTNPETGGAPPPAGSWWTGSEHDKLEAINLRSGAGEAMQDAQIVRAPIAAASGFGQHYLGDPSSTTLSGGTTLELPTMMEVSAWQETLEGLLCWFTDRVIEAAVQAGQLGGMMTEADAVYEKPLNECRIGEDTEQLEERTGKDLSYSFQMPYPGRRNLPDVTTMVTAVAMAYDPMGQNVELRRLLLHFLFNDGLMSDDPARDVDEVMPDDGSKLPPPPPPPPAPGEVPGAGAAPAPSPTGRETSEAPQYKNQKTRSQPPGNEMGAGPRTKEVLREGVQEGTEGAQELLDAMITDAGERFATFYADPAAILPETNGNGAQAAAR